MIKKLFFLFVFAIAFLQKVYSQTLIISPQKLDSILKQNGVIFHKEFTYLAFCESGLQNKNLFGMHHPRVRFTYSKSSYGKPARFDCIEDSIKDFLVWYSLLLPQKNEEFIAYLKKRAYNPNPKYYSALYYVICQNKFKL